MWKYTLDIFIVFLHEIKQGVELNDFKCIGYAKNIPSH